MEDLFRFLPLILIYLLVVSSGSKKKKKSGKTRRNAPMRTASQGEKRDARARRRTAQTAEGFARAFEQERAAAEGTPHEGGCVDRPMHLHDVTQAQLHSAQEGEDPCHAGGFDAVAAAEEPSAPEAVNPIAQDVLRGVVMSEILMRPQERRALQRKRYHG